MLYSLFYVPYLCDTYWLCITSTLSCYYEKRDYVILKYQFLKYQACLCMPLASAQVSELLCRRNWCGAFRFTFNGNYSGISYFRQYLHIGAGILSFGVDVFRL